MKEVLYLTEGTRFTFLSGPDKGNVFVLLSKLRPCARTEGCYKAKYEKNGVEAWIFPTELEEFGYQILPKKPESLQEELMTEKEEILINYILKNMYSCPLPNEDHPKYGKLAEAIYNNECVGFCNEGCKECLYRHLDLLK